MSEFLRLSRVAAASRPPELAVAVRGGRPLPWSTLVADVGRLATVLEARGGGAWLLFAEDCYAFTVGLLAIWQAGGTAVVPPNDQPGTVASLGEGLQGLVSDRSLAVPGRPSLDPLAAGDVDPWGWRPLAEDVPRLLLCTSGTTGARKAIPKTLAHLGDEVEGLEGRWGARLAGRPVFATVSHHHIYGLLFRLLWPLCAGRPFVSEVYSHADELVPRLRAAGRATLVSAPVHLRRLRQSRDFRALGDACQPVFSSGGPLDEETADALLDAFGEAPIEVFGSTETGGVAWRQQSRDLSRLAWTPFPRVEVSAEPDESRLVVRSSFVSLEAGATHFTMSDRADAWPDGRFLLLGRGDRIVKVGEARVSLPEMEARLHEHGWVADAGLTLLHRGPEARIAAVVVLTPSGREALAREGRGPVGTALRHHLGLHWSVTLLPRVWRYVDRLPEDAQGKVSTGALRALVSSMDDRSVVSAELIEERRDDRVCERALRVPLDLATLEGHFPGFPVVPGVVQVQWALEAARALAGSDLQLAAFDVLRFKSLLRPGQTFRLRVELSESGEALSFRVWNGITVFSSGRARVARPKAPAW